MRARIFTEPQQGASYEQLLTVARTAEELGFDAFFRSDHFLRMGDGSGLPGPTDAWVTLGGLARDTSTIRLGTLVTSATFRLPGPLAVAVAEVDHMSSGRVELGIGAGWYEAEHTAYGIPFPPLGERFERLAEQLSIIHGLWSTPADGSFSFEGRHYRVTDSPALPRPLQRPYPPIIIGGIGGGRTPRLAARYADEYNAPFIGPDFARQQYDKVHAACERIGRDPSSIKLSAALVVCVGSNEDEFRRRASNIGRDPDELRSYGVGGTPGEALETLRTWAKLGIDRVYLQVLDVEDLDHLRLIAVDALPHLSSLA